MTATGFEQHSAPMQLFSPLENLMCEQVNVVQIEYGIF